MVSRHSGVLLALVLPMLLGAIGCAPRPLPRRLFALSPDAPERVQVDVRPRLRVHDFECSDEYAGPIVRYRLSEVELRSYRYNRWVVLPGAMVAEAVRRYLDRSGRFVLVAPGEAADVELVGRVEVLEHVARQGRWSGRVTVALDLQRPRDGRVIHRHRIDGEQEAEEQELGSVVEAMSAVLAEGLGDALPDLVEAAAVAESAPAVEPAPDPGE